jgi:hypothetical protein
MQHQGVEMADKVRHQHHLVSEAVVMEVLEF